MDINIIAFWNRVKTLCKQQNITQKDLAKRINLNERYIENQIARKTVPDIVEVCNIAEFFSVSIDYLITGRAAESSPDDLARLKDIISRAKAVLSES